jgi:hypothetical protein
MKKLLGVIAMVLVGLTTCVIAGTAIYRWMTQGDEIRCVAHEFAFGCSTTLGHVLTGVGVLVVVAALVLWARFRGH